ncbi:MAG TPA: archaeosortase/exosortase family protein [Oculatellaceae cyanobacterium]
MKASRLTPELIAGIIAFWPVLYWYGTRTLDKSDEPWGLISLLTAIYFLVKDKGDSKTNLISPVVNTTWNIWIACLLVTLYSTFYTSTPHLVQSIVMVTTMWLLFSKQLPRTSRIAIFGLLVLALPLMPSLNFFASYPLQAIVATGSAALLSLLGLSVSPDGTLMNINEHLVSIDAPCSGIQMLWTALYLSMIIALRFELNSKKTFFLVFLTIPITIAANILRASILVLFDRFAKTPSWYFATQYEPQMHLLVGLVIFAVICIALIHVGMRLSAAMDSKKTNNRHQANDLERAKQRQPAEHQQQSNLKASHLLVRSSVRRTAFVSLCCIAGLIPLMPNPTKSAATAIPPPIWPTHVSGIKIMPVECLQEEQAFAKDFPGYMKRFTDGSNAYFVRYISSETRQLHPSRDCFRGMGYQLNPGPIIVETDGTRWSSFRARKSTSEYTVTERVYDSNGQSWTDISEWYWAAALHNSKGPWFDITCAKPIIDAGAHKSN